MEHRGDAGWLNDPEEKTQVEKQGDLTIDSEKLRAMLRKIPNWKAAGPDNVQGFWLKNMRKLHQRMASQLQECLDGRGIPERITKGRTVLLIKEKVKGNAVGNNRPITCLPIMWKVLTGIIGEICTNIFTRAHCYLMSRKVAEKRVEELRTNWL